MSKDSQNPLKVRISTLPARGHLIAEELNLETLNGRMQECDTNDVEFTSAPSFEITFRKAPFGAEGFGYIQAEFTQSCSRCLDPRPKEIRLKCDIIVKDRPAPDSVEEDVNLIFSDDDYIDLGNYLEELLILKLDTFWAPPLNENGKCSDCDVMQNWNDASQTEKSSKNNLGSLLQKALEKEKV